MYNVNPIEYPIILDFVGKSSWQNIDGCKLLTSSVKLTISMNLPQLNGKRFRNFM